MITAQPESKRYSVIIEKDDDYVDPINSNKKRIKITLLDTFENKMMALPEFPIEKNLLSYQIFLDTLKKYCQHLNEKHEDDLRYLKEVDKYIKDE